MGNATQDANPETVDVSGVCAYCLSALADAEELVQCPHCGALHHPECWEENKGCGMYGCSQAPATQPRGELEIPVSYWGRERKPCPACGREILAAAIRCAGCGAVFDSERPEDAAAYEHRLAVVDRLPAARKTVIWLFALSVLTCTAPVAGVVFLFWTSFHKEELRALPRLYATLSAFGVAAGLGQTAVLIVMAVLFAVFRA